MTKSVKRCKVWRIHAHRELVIELGELCERLGITKRSFMDDLLRFGLFAVKHSSGRGCVLDLLQEAAKKVESGDSSRHAFGDSEPPSATNPETGRQAEQVRT